MQRIIILGCPGSGKSTFSVKLHHATGLSLFHLDNIWWKADGTHISRNEFDKKLDSLISNEAWIIDGDFSRTYERRVAACDTVFFLDYEESVCMDGIHARLGKKRPDMPWVDQELDPALVHQVKTYKAENCPQLSELFKKYPDKKVIIFHNREQADEWLEKYQREQSKKEYHNMPIDKSCGAVVFTRKDGQIQYVIVREVSGFCSFPKGHVEAGETEEQTAIREIYEETGLTPTLISGFREVEEYIPAEMPDVKRQVVYFLAKFEDQELQTRPGEIDEVMLLSYEQALESFEYESQKNILKAAKDFLEKANE